MEKLPLEVFFLCCSTSFGNQEWQELGPPFHEQHYTMPNKLCDNLSLFLEEDSATIHGGEDGEEEPIEILKQLLGDLFHVPEYQRNGLESQLPKSAESSEAPEETCGDDNCDGGDGDRGGVDDSEEGKDSGDLASLGQEYDEHLTNTSRYCLKTNLFNALI
ncbi:hypothetical protein J437_LFUL005906 [Ladona fulva]|uniref:Uncharacterized protein n=1 Tax=Ladona fulva TaxID=123851 RepID=A0A8K0P317_LADFU|nr:hypothetical protein J437_LFUL005906 [Ladona fulva]